MAGSRRKLQNDGFKRLYKLLGEIAVKACSLLRLNHEGIDWTSRTSYALSSDFAPESFSTNALPSSKDFIAWSPYALAMA